MSEQNTLKWKQLFQQHCQGWDAGSIQRYMNIPNDPEDIDDEELAACAELIDEINSKKHPN